MRWALAGAGGEEILGGEHPHLGARADGGAAEVRDYDDLVEGVKCGFECGFFFKHVEPRAGDLLGAQGLNEGLFINDGAARGVDEDRGGEHGGELIFPDEMMRFGVVGDVEREKIRGGDDLVKGSKGNAEGGFLSGAETGAVPVDDVEIETAGAFGHGLADAPEADEPEGGARDIGSEHLHGIPAGPLLGAHEAFALAQASGGGEEQGERDIGGGLGENSGGIGDGDFPRGGGGDVDIVKADPEVGDHAQAGNGRDEFGADGIGDVAQQGIAALEAGDNLGAAEYAVSWVEGEIGVLPQEREDGGRDFAGEKYFRFHREEKSGGLRGRDGGVGGASWRKRGKAVGARQGWAR